MEKSQNTSLIPADFAWSGAGSWDALREVSEKDNAGIAARNHSNLVSVNFRNSLVHSPRKLVALVGVEDLIVVETDDALLICKRGSSQDVRQVVDSLEEEKRGEYL